MSRTFVIVASSTRIRGEDARVPLSSKAPNHDRGVSSAWTGDTPKAASKDSSGRQLAIALPAIPSSAQARIPFAKPRISRACANSSVVKVNVPENVGEVADSISAATRSLTKIGAETARDVLGWLTAFVKQMSQAPTVTPAGEPYAGGMASSGMKLMYMSDHRLKTIVMR